MNHDPQTIAVAVVDAAVNIQLDVFADPHGEARNVLILLVSTTYSALRDDAKVHGRAAGRELGGSAFAPGPD